MSNSLFEKRLLILAGKGGVGRTTVAAALARAAAARGRRVLLAQTASAERLGKLLGRPGPIGPTVVRVADRIDAVNMTPREALHEYALQVLRYEAVYRALFDNRAVRGFLNAVPGLDAYAMLGKAWWHTTEKVGHVPKYDLVILDGPASGHGLAMLRIPQAILDAAPTGPLVADARALRSLLLNPLETAVVPVTLPEELPVNETLELVRAVRQEKALRLPLAPVIVNAYPPGRLSEPGVAEVLDALPSVTGDADLDVTLRTAEGVRARRRTAESMLARLRAEADLKVVTLPWLPSADLGAREAERLARELEALLT